MQQTNSIAIPRWDMVSSNLAPVYNPGGFPALFKNLSTHAKSLAPETLLLPGTDGCLVVSCVPKAHKALPLSLSLPRAVQPSRPDSIAALVRCRAERVEVARTRSSISTRAHPDTRASGWTRHRWPRRRRSFLLTSRTIPSSTQATCGGGSKATCGSVPPSSSRHTL